MKRNINWKKFASYTLILNTYTCLSLLIWNALYRYTGVYCNDVASFHAIYNVITNCKFQTISSTKLTAFLLHRRYTCNRNWLNTEYDLVIIKKVAWHKHWYTFTTISLFKKKTSAWNTKYNHVIHKWWNNGDRALKPQTCWRRGNVVGKHVYGPYIIKVTNKTCNITVELLTHMLPTWSYQCTRSP